MWFRAAFNLSAAFLWLGQPVALHVSWRVPGIVRKRLRHWVLDRTRRKAMHALPVSLNVATDEENPSLRVVVMGAFFTDWNDALIDRVMWQGITNVGEVRRIVDPDELSRLPMTKAETVVIPLGEQHIRRMPPGYRSLVPELHALEIMSDKAKFAAFMEEQGLAMLCPQTYNSVRDVAFPCVLKPLDENGGYGVQVVKSRGQLEQLLQTGIYAGQPYLLQAYIGGDAEYTFHGVCRDGQILWSYTVASPSDARPRIGLDRGNLSWVAPSPLVRAQIGEVLFRLRFSGPFCANYKLLPTGDIALFEINPRLGGSLMVQSQRGALRESLNCVIENTR